MTIATSEEHRAVCEAIAAWAEAIHSTELIRSDLDKPRDQWVEHFAQLGEFGVLGVALPESADGLGGTVFDAAAMIEECGYRLVPGPIVETAIAALALAEATSVPLVDLRDRLMLGQASAVFAARVVAADAPEAVLDLGFVRGYRDGSVILYRIADDAGDLRWRLLPPGEGQVEAIAAESVDGLGSVAQLRVSGLGPDSALCAPHSEILSGIHGALTAAYQSGVARWALDTAVAYAKVRTQFGAAIGTFQAVKHLCADILCRSEQLTAAAWDLANACDAAREAPDDAHNAEQLTFCRLAADVLISDLCVPAVQDCIQVLGGIGFTFEHDAHLYLRVAHTDRALRSGAEAQRRLLAELGLAGRRRSFTVDLTAVADRRDDIRAEAQRLAAVPADERRQALARSGLLAPHWPKPYGLGADAPLQLLVDAELELAGVERPDLVIGAWAVPTILEHGTDDQRERFVVPTLDGDLVWCQLFSEPEAGSDLASLRTKAIRDDSDPDRLGWRLTGQKIWTSQAHNADWGICLARTNSQAPQHKGITYFLIDMTSAGIDIRPLRELTGRANFNEVFLDDVFVPDDCVVGEVDAGWRLARTTLANERVAMGGSGLGKEMEAVLMQLDELARELTDTEHRTLGRLIADAYIGQVLDARAVSRRLAGHDPGALSSVRKLIGVEHRQSVPDFGVATLGVDGLVASPAVDTVLQNRCLSIAGGTTQILRTAAAERVLGLPRR